MLKSEIILDYSDFSETQCQERASDIMEVINQHEEWSSDKFVKYRLPDIVFWRKELNKLSARVDEIKKMEVVA
jgi:hypothetical protein